MKTDQEWIEINQKRWQEMPANLRERAVAFLQKELSSEDKDWLRNTMKEHGTLWWCEGCWHFGGGMCIRNLLRKGVCLDGELPSGNWDDYYIPVVEAAVGDFEGETPIPGSRYNDWNQW